MELWIATGNKGKLSEYKLLLKEFAELKIFSLVDIPSFTPRPEDGLTFLDNARIKAKSLAAVKKNVWILGEDSGLEVKGLDNLPGIHTARYAGPHARDSENMAKLLKMLSIRNVTDRSAQFQCATVVLSPTAEEFIYTGILKGTIASKPVGQMGFGYDPVFVPENETKTLAELGPGYKTTHTHRALALKGFIEKLRSL